jgi:hypothetical protein
MCAFQKVLHWPCSSAGRVAPGFCILPLMSYNRVMFSFFSPKSELGIVFHIGSSSIGAGLIRLKKGEIPHIIYSLREDIPFHEKIEPEKFLADMADTLKKVNLRVAKEGIVHLKFTEFGSLKIKHVYYVFASPWSVTQTKVATIKKTEGFVLTKEMVDHIVEEQEHIFEKETLGREDLGDRLTAIEKRVIQIKLNGYETADPFGKRTESADISLFVSLIPKSVLDKVFDISMTTYHPKDTNAFSFPLASFSTIRDVFGSMKDFMFIDIGGELSDLSVVKDGLILETTSFPLGRHFLVRRISKAFATSIEEAASLVRLYHEGNADGTLEEKLKPVIDKASEEWLAAFNASLSSLAEKMTLPSSLFALINNDFVNFFMRALQDEKVSEFGVNDVPLSVTLINHDKLKSAVMFSKNADKDPFIAILTAFVGRAYESKVK